MRRHHTFSTHSDANSGPYKVDKLLFAVLGFRTNDKAKIAEYRTGYDLMVEQANMTDWIDKVFCEMPSLEEMRSKVGQKEADDLNTIIKDSFRGGYIRLLAELKPEGPGELCPDPENKKGIYSKDMRRKERLLSVMNHNGVEYLQGMTAPVGVIYNAFALHKGFDRATAECLTFWVFYTVYTESKYDRVVMKVSWLTPAVKLAPYVVKAAALRFCEPDTLVTYVAGMITVFGLALSSDRVCYNEVVEALSKRRLTISYLTVCALFLMEEITTNSAAKKCLKTKSIDKCVKMGKYSEQQVKNAFKSANKWWKKAENQNRIETLTNEIFAGLM